MNDKDQLLHLAARVRDLYRTATKHGVAAGDFLTPAEQAYLQTCPEIADIRSELSFYGGFDDAERRVPLFWYKGQKRGEGGYPKNEIDWDSINWEKDDWWMNEPSAETESEEDTQTLCPADAQIVCLQLRVPKGADLPDHRACLGALMNLGIERKTVGDIVVKSDTVWIFCKSAVAPYLESSLTRVAKSPVTLKPTELASDFGFEHTFETLELTLSSLRADAFYAAITGESREVAKKAVVNGLLRRNHLPLSHPDATLSVGDLLSVTGKGRYRFTETKGQTKKGRLRVVLQKYV